jgi:hypothetical protein
VHARVEDAIRTGKDTGIGRFPSHGFEINQLEDRRELALGQGDHLGVAAHHRSP